MMWKSLKLIILLSFQLKQHLYRSAGHRSPVVHRSRLSLDGDGHFLLSSTKSKDRKGIKVVR